MTKFTIFCKPLLYGFVAILVSCVCTSTSLAQLFALDRATDSLHIIDTSNGSSTFVGDVGFDVSFSGLSTNGGPLFASDVFDGGWGLSAIDTMTGAGTTVGPHGASNVHAIAHQNGTLWGFELGFGLVTVDEATGAISDVADSLSTNFYAADVDTSTNTLYAIGEGGGLYEIDTMTGTDNLIGLTGIDFEFVNNVQSIGLAYNPMDNQLYLLGNDIDGAGDGLYTLDVNTGAATFIGSSGLIEADALEFISIVPEPTTLAVLLPMALLAGCRRRARG